MEEKTLLFTGGSGLLGTEIKRLLPKAYYPSSTEFDITNFELMDKYIKDKDIKRIFHAAAFTSPPRIDANPVKAIDTNIIGTANIVKLAMKYNIKLIYISSDYVFKGDKGLYKEEDALYPVNKYAWSKLGGECATKLYDNSIIIRTSFTPNIFPYEKAFIDQWSSRQTVNVIAKKIIPLIWSEFKGIIHIGGERKSIYEYAMKTNPKMKIGKLSINEVSFSVPTDTSLSTKKYNNLFKLKTRNGK